MRTDRALRPIVNKRLWKIAFPLRSVKINMILLTLPSNTSPSSSSISGIVMLLILLTGPLNAGETVLEPLPFNRLLMDLTEPLRDSTVVLTDPPLGEPVSISIPSSFSSSAPEER